MVEKFAVFFLFLAILALLTYASVKLLRWTTVELIRDKWFWPAEALNVVSIATICLLVYSLSRFFSVELVLGLLAASQIGVLLTAISWGFLGSGTPDWGSDLTKAYLEDGLRHPRLQIVHLLIPTLAMLAYLIMAGLWYFGGDSGINSVRALFQYTLILIAISLLFAASTNIRLMVSEHLSYAGRTFILSSVAGQLAPTGIYLLLAFWAFGSGGDASLFAPAMFPKVVLALSAYFALGALVPYMIGSQSAKRFQTQLIDKEIVFLDAAARHLRVTSPSRYTDPSQLEVRLKRLQERAVVERDHVSTTGILGLLLTLEKDPDEVLSMPFGGFVQLPEKMRTWLKSGKLTSERHPGFRYVARLNRLQDECREILEGILSTEDEAIRRETASAWAAEYDKRIQDNQKELERLSKEKPWLVLLVGAAATPFLSAVLTELGKWIATFIPSAVGS